MIPCKVATVTAAPIFINSKQSFSQFLVQILCLPKPKTPIFKFILSTRDNEIRTFEPTLGPETFGESSKHFLLVFGSSAVTKKAFDPFCPGGITRTTHEHNCRSLSSSSCSDSEKYFVLYSCVENSRKPI